MKFPKGTTKRQKHSLKKIWIESLTNGIISHEQRVKDMEDQVKNIEETLKNYKDKIATTKKHIQEYQTLLKEAEDTKVD